MDPSRVDDLLSAADLSRAAALSSMISKSGDFKGSLDACRLLSQKDMFQEVQFASVEKGEPQFAMARAEGVVYFAFCGTEKVVDVAGDSKINRDRLGDCHEGFHHLSGVFLGLLPGSRILPTLLEFISSKERIIFCGHSMGGAVAHMVLMRLLLEDEMNKESLHRLAHEDLRSVAFGAPLLCDRVAADSDFFRDKPEHRRRFITFVNRGDPIPRLFYDLRKTVDTLKPNIEDAVYCETPIGGTIKQRSPGGDLKSVWLEAMETEARKRVAAGTDFMAIGFYVFLTSEQTPEVVDSASDRLKELLHGVQFKPQCLEEQKCMSYCRALIGSNLIVEVHKRGRMDDRTAAKILNGTPFEPELGKAIGQQIDDGEHGGCWIQITGKNLLLPRKVTLNGEEIQVNEIARSTRHELDFMHCFSEKESVNYKKTGVLGTVNVETPFGSSKRVVDQAKQKYKILQELVLAVRILAKLGSIPDSNELKCLDNVMRCLTVAEAPQKDSKVTFSSLRCGVELDHTRELSKIADDAGTHVNQPFVFEFKFSSADKLAVQKSASTTLRTGTRSALCLSIALGVKAGVAGTMVAGPAAGAAIGVVVAAAAGSYSVTSVVAGAAFVWVAGGVGWVALKCFDSTSEFVMKHMKKYFTSSYEAQVKYAVQELRLWNRNGIVGGDDYSEGALVELVNDANEEFTLMIESAISAHGTPLRDLHLKGLFMSFATEESTRKFLRKIYAIVETRKLFNQIVSSKYFVAVLGPEDVGKTSFILEMVKGNAESEEVGTSVHTNKVTPYTVDGDIILLDFPGMTGETGNFSDWWEEFGALVDTIVLLLNFDNDVKTDQTDTYSKLKSRSGLPILVAFNKVDKHVDSRTIVEYKKKNHFYELKRKSVNAFRCSQEDVFYAAFSPSPDLRNNVKVLLEALGIVDVQAFKQELCRRKRKSS